MKKNLLKKSKKKSLYAKDALILITEHGLPGIFYQISLVVYKSTFNIYSKEQVLSLINKAVDHLTCTIKNISTKNKISHKVENIQNKEKVIENWNDILVKQKYFYLLQCVLLHKHKEIRAAGLRLFRYIIQSEDDVKIIIKYNILPLIIRSIDLSLDNQIERIHGIRLTRHILLTAPQIFPISLARALAALAQDGARERDKLLRSSQAILGELAILNSQVFVACGGIEAVLYNVLDCSLARMNEALLSSILFLLNDPHWKSSCCQLHTIIAPLTDVYYKHNEYSAEYFSKNEERELRTKSSCLALLTSLRSWPGLITLYQPKDEALSSIINVLKLPDETSKVVVLEFFYDLFRIPICNTEFDYETCLQQRTRASSADTDSMKLLEGFVVSETKYFLPNIAKYRPNLIQNYLALLLQCFISEQLFDVLCEVIISSSLAVSIKATMLLGELLYLADNYLPDMDGCSSHGLPLLSEKAMSKVTTERILASQAITALLHLSKFLSSQYDFTSSPHVYSLYLENIINTSRETIANLSTDDNSTSDVLKVSKWHGKDHDDLIQQTIKESKIFINEDRDWNWNLLLPIFKWPSNALIMLEEHSYQGLIKKLLHYFKPSSKLFADVPCSDPSARTESEVLVTFCEFLLLLPQDFKDEYLGTFLMDLRKNLAEISGEKPSHLLNLSTARLNSTLSQYYFLAVGKLTQSNKGYDMLKKYGIFEEFLKVVEFSIGDVYCSLIVTCMDYKINGQNRIVLNKVLTESKESCRIYATQLMKSYIRSGNMSFSSWGIEFLVGQLNDESPLVVTAALDVLDEALDNQDCLEEILKLCPTLQHLGDAGQLLFAQMVSSPKGFKTYQDYNYISTQLDKWGNVYNFKYVKLMQIKLSESLTQLQRGEDGLYGRRTGNKHVIHDVYVLPHLYGSLTSHKDGFALLTAHQSVQDCIKLVNDGNVGSVEKIFKLKAAIWALGHLGSSTSGIDYLSSNGVVSEMVKLACSCPVYSVRGIVFNALCLLAVTRNGVNELKKYGWESVQRAHHESVQLHLPESRSNNDSPMKEFSPSKKLNETALIEFEEFEMNKSTGFDFQDESEDENETFSLLLDDLYETDVTVTRKSQTLPHDSKPSSSYMGHIRSLSDCAPVIEEINGSSHSHKKLQNSSLAKRKSRIKNKILSSFRRKTTSSGNRRDSVGSKTSNSSSASEKMFAFFHSSRRKKLNKENISAGNTGTATSPSTDFDLNSTYSRSDQAGTSDDEPLKNDQAIHSSPNKNRRTNVSCFSNDISPIASGIPVHINNARELGNVDISQKSQATKLNNTFIPQTLIPTSSPSQQRYLHTSLLTTNTQTSVNTLQPTSPAASRLFPQNSSVVQTSSGTNSSTATPSSEALTTPSCSGGLLRVKAMQSRGIPESSHEELRSKNSLRDFLTSNYEQSSPFSNRAILDVKNLSKSPSACSEISSGRSKVGSTKLVAHSQREICGIDAIFSEETDLPSSGLRYFGLTVPLNLNSILLDSDLEKKHLSDKDNLFPVLSESDFPPAEKSSTFENRKSLEKKMRMNVNENEAFEYHSTTNCLSCFIIASTIEAVSNNKITDEESSDEKDAELSIFNSPSLQRVKKDGNTVSSELTSPYSSSSNSCDESSSVSKPTEKLVNRYLIRKEILKHICNLSTCFIVKRSEMGLLALKQGLSWAFQDLCLYTEVFEILSRYSFRLTSRRFIQELFSDLSFKQIFDRVDLLLIESRQLYGETIDLAMTKIETQTLKPLKPSYIQEFQKDDFEDFDLLVPEV